MMVETGVYLNHNLSFYLSRDRDTCRFSFYQRPPFSFRAEPSTASKPLRQYSPRPPPILPESSASPRDTASLIWQLLPSPAAGRRYSPASSSGPYTLPESTVQGRNSGSSPWSVSAPNWLVVLLWLWFNMLTKERQTFILYSKINVHGSTWYS